MAQTCLRFLVSVMLFHHFCMTAFHGLALAVITTHGALATIFRSISGVMHVAVRRSSLLWYFRGGFAAYTSIIHHIIVDLPGLFVTVYLIQSLVLRTCLWTFVICVVDAPKLSCGFRIVPAEESSSHALHGATISVQYGYKTAIVIAFLLVMMLLLVTMTTMIMMTLLILVILTMTSLSSSLLH